VYGLPSSPKLRTPRAELSRAALTLVALLGEQITGQIPPALALGAFDVLDIGLRQRQVGAVQPAPPTLGHQFVGSRRQPIGCSRRWRSTAPPGRSGMCGPKRNARSVPPTSPSTISTSWSRCSLAKSSTRDRSRSAALMTPSPNQRHCGGPMAHRLHRRRWRAVHLCPNPRG
jgi:hypothetical protein